MFWASFLFGFLLEAYCFQILLTATVLRLSVLHLDATINCSCKFPEEIEPRKNVADQPELIRSVQAKKENKNGNNTGRNWDTSLFPS